VRKSLEQLLAADDDFALCNAVFLMLNNGYGDDIDVSLLSAPERVVYLVWAAYGIIGNGGFRFLFEGDFKGDPHFILTAEAFQATGCKKATEAVRRTLAMFPSSRPPKDIHERLRHYLSRVKQWPTDMDVQFFAADSDLKKCLAGYFRLHADSFRHLQSSRRKPALKGNPNSPDKTAQPRSSCDTPVDDLPHWARVALAARCARQVLPLLFEYWPRIPSTYSEAVTLAIELAERSAAEGQPVEGLDDAGMKAPIAAGAALATRTEYAKGEPRPENAYAGTIAAKVASTAAMAAEAAAGKGNPSLIAGLEAWTSANDAAQSADRPSIAESLQADLVKLRAVALRGKWNDKTRVPVEIWSML
jgi:hypothetical protein